MPVRKLLSSIEAMQGAAQCAYMKKREPIPEIAEAVLHWMPNASEEEQKQATVRLRGLAAAHRIYLRLEVEGRFPIPCDNYKDGDTVYS